MTNSTLAVYCKKNEYSSERNIGIVDPVYLTDMLQTLSGQDNLLNVLQMLAEQHSAQEYEGIGALLWRQLRGLCRVLVNTGYPEPVLRMALMLSRYEKEGEAYKEFLRKIGDLELCGKKLETVCPDAVQYYFEHMDTEAKYGKEFELLTRYIREELLEIPSFDLERLQEKLDCDDALTMAGWCSNYLAIADAGILAQMMTCYLMPGITALCKADSVTDKPYKYAIAPCLLAQYLQWTDLFAHSQMNLCYTPEEILCMSNGVEDLDTSELLSGVQKIFVKDVSEGRHLQRFVTLYPGFGHAYCGMMDCKGTVLFDRIQQVTGDQLHRLAAAAAYCFYAQYDVDGAAKLILEHFPQISDKVTGFTGLQRIAVMCFLETEDTMLALDLYRYVCKLYERYCRHSNYSRRIPHRVMYLVEQHKDSLLQNMGVQCVRAVAQIKEAKCGRADEEEILKNIQESDKYQKICAAAKLLFGSVAELEAKINKKQDAFFAAIGEEYEELYQRLGLQQAQSIHDMLIEGEAILSFLKCLESMMPSGVDYTPALIEITKSLELVLNQVFARIPKFSSDGLSDAQRRAFCFGDKKKRSLEMGPAVNLLYPKDTNEPDVFLKWKIGDILDVEKLRKMTGLNLTVDNSVRHFADGEDVSAENRKLLRDAIAAVCNFRNKAAHKDPVTKLTYEKAEKKLLSGEYLLWVLLYITKMP